MNNERKNEYRNKEWFALRERYFETYGKRCLKCERGEDEAVIQLHHTFYDHTRKIWEYDLEDFECLCSGCHAREHKILEPNDGWHLISVDDLGGMFGNCKRQKTLNSPCNHSIRHEHFVYHPDVGYRIVGSTCVDHLVQEDKDKLLEVKEKKDIQSKIQAKYNLFIDKPLHQLNRKPWKLGNKKKPYLLRYDGRKEIEGKSLDICAFFYNSSFNYCIQIYKNNKEVLFERTIGKNKGTVSNNVYGDLIQLQKLITLIDLCSKAQMEDKTLVATAYYTEIKTVLDELKYKIVKS